MNSLKITSFVIFIILWIIVILLISGKYVNEGFISYAFNKQPIDFVWIPQYNKNYQNPSVVKLYDNLYFDSKNANLIEVDADPDGSISNVDNVGNTITNVYITKRDSPETTTNYKINNKNDLDKNTVISVDNPDSLISSVSESYTSFKYDSQSKNTNSYNVFYLAWDKSTYIHIIDTSGITAPANNIGTFMFNNQGDMKKVIFSKNSTVGLNNYIGDTDASNNKYVFMNEKYNPMFTKLPSFKENDKGALVFQMSKYVRFDPQYGTLIILTEKSGTTWDVYDRYGTVWKQNTYFDEEITAGISNVEFTSWGIVDKLGQNMVLYSAVGKKTLISIIQYTNSNSKTYSLVNAKRFNELGTVDYKENIRITKPVSTIEGLETKTSQEIYWQNISKLFWDTANNEPSPVYDDKTGLYLGDKTIIPSVCPSRSEKGFDFGSIRGSSASASGSVLGQISGSSASASGSMLGSIRGSSASASGSVLGQIRGSSASASGSVLGQISGSSASASGSVLGQIRGSFASASGSVVGSTNGSFASA